MVHHTQVPNVAVHNVPQEMPSNVERVRRSTMTIGGLMYVPRHMVFNAAHGKTACHLGLNMGTIAALLSNFEPFWCSTTRKNGKLRSSRELRRQLRKHLLHDIKLEVFRDPGIKVIDGRTWLHEDKFVTGGRGDPVAWATAWAAACSKVEALVSTSKSNHVVLGSLRNHVICLLANCRVLVVNWAMASSNGMVPSRC